MKRYILIKEFPIDISIGSIAVFCEYRNVYSVDTNDKIIRIAPRFIENYPEFWKEIRIPLFTTEDGVDIYKGDNCVVVVKGNFLIIESTNFVGDSTEDFWYFSTKEAAEKFLDENKLLYSKKDIRNIISRIKKEGQHSSLTILDNFLNDQ